MLKEIEEKYFSKAPPPCASIKPLEINKPNPIPLLKGEPVANLE